MKKIILLCAGGMSTSLLVSKMEDAAAQLGIECQVSAHPVTAAKSVATDANIVLLGPQIRFELNNIKKILPDIEVRVIDMIDYGMIDGKAIVDKIVDFIK
ncbi:MAG: PTS sugar transporter subunit IIB [Anaerorhabdus sp.]|uniref:PTS sugar transporter subunit IIB n=1 Tax=Anaerorhabdus sp. TaxID=1872524 RepID=UPI002FC7C56B